MKMSFKVDFATMLDYSPRGNSEVSVKSRMICGNIKAGNPRIIDRLIFYIKDLPEDYKIKSLFLDNTILVPVPRSTPLVEGGLWPSKILAEHFVNSGLGSDFKELIQRIDGVPKSSKLRSADERPSCNTHYNSLKAIPILETPKRITLIDDVFTLGRTSCACVRRLKDVFPDASISIFTAMRTRGLRKDIEELVVPSFNTLEYFSDYDHVKLPD